MSQTDLAFHMECSQCLVSRWESGSRSPGLSDLLAVIDITGGAVDLPTGDNVRTRYGAEEHLPALGVVLRHHREDQRLTLFEAAKRARILPRYVAAFEAGRCPSLSELAALALALGTTPEEIVRQVLDTMANSPRVPASHLDGRCDSAQAAD